MLMKTRKGEPFISLNAIERGKTRIPIEYLRLNSFIVRVSDPVLPKNQIRGSIFEILLKD